MKDVMSPRQGTAAAFVGGLSLSAAAAGIDWRGAALAVPVAALAGWCWGRLAGQKQGWAAEWTGRMRIPLTLLYIVSIVILSGTVLGSAGQRLTRPEGKDVGWVIVLIWLPTLWLTIKKPAVLGRAAEIFRPAMGCVVIVVLLLGAGQVEWERLWRPSGTLWVSFVRAAGISGWGVMAALMAGGEDRTARRAGWGAAAAAVLTLMSAVTVGTLGPVLAASEERPFFVLSVGLGQTSRVEGLVSALWLIADITLVGLIGQTARRLWMVVRLPREKGGAVLIALIALGIGLWSGLTGQTEAVFFKIVPITGLILGVGLPGGALLWQKGRKALGRGAYFGVRKGGKGEDVGG